MVNAMWARESEVTVPWGAGYQVWFVAAEREKRVDELLSSEPITNVPTLNHKLSAEDIQIVGEKCFQAGIWIDFIGAEIVGGKLIIIGDDGEDTVKAAIKTTTHSIPGGDFSWVSGIRDIVPGKEWLVKPGFDNESFEVPRDVTILWN